MEDKNAILDAIFYGFDIMTGIQPPNVKPKKQYGSMKECVIPYCEESGPAVRVCENNHTMHLTCVERMVRGSWQCPICRSNYITQIWEEAKPLIENAYCKPFKIPSPYVYRGVNLIERKIVDHDKKFDQFHVTKNLN